MSQPVAIRRSYVVESSPSVVWSEPSNPGAVLGNVIAAPFRLIGGGLTWTGRALSGQPEYVGSREYLAPVGERVVTTYRTQTIRHTPCGRITYMNEPALMPVGERFTTIRTYRSAPLLEPVGERFTTVRTIRSYKMLPVGERFTTVKVIQHKRLMPVGEKFTTVKLHKQLMPIGEKFTTVKVIHHKQLIPVGERITTVKVIHHRQLLPVGERTWIRTTRVLASPSCGCF